MRIERLLLEIIRYILITWKLGLLHLSSCALDLSMFELNGLGSSVPLVPGYLLSTIPLLELPIPDTIFSLHISKIIIVRIKSLILIVYSFYNKIQKIQHTKTNQKILQIFGFGFFKIYSLSNSWESKANILVSESLEFVTDTVGESSMQSI